MSANYERNQRVGRQFLWVIGSPGDVPEMTAPKEEKDCYYRTKEQTVREKPET